MCSGSERHLEPLALCPCCHVKTPTVQAFNRVVVIGPPQVAAVTVIGIRSPICPRVVKGEGVITPLVTMMVIAVNHSALSTLIRYQVADDLLRMLLEHGCVGHAAQQFNLLWK